MGDREGSAQPPREMDAGVTRRVSGPEGRCRLFVGLGSAFALQTNVIHNGHYPQGHRSSSEEKMPETELVEVEMPFYNLSLGEETEVEGPVLKLSAEDSESHPEPADQALKDKKVKVPGLGRDC